MSTSRVASATSLEPQALKNSLPPPNVPVPRLRAGTMKPDAPSCRYSIVLLLGDRLRGRAHAAAHGRFEGGWVFRISVVAGEQHAGEAQRNALRRRRAGHRRAL